MVTSVQISPLGRRAREPDRGHRTCQGVTTSPTAPGASLAVHSAGMQMADGPPGTPSRRTATPTDGELMAPSLDEPEAFAVLFDRHADAVHRYLGRRVGQLADDLLSETFLVAFRRRAAYRAVHLEVRPWLFGIATNVVRGHVRAEQRRYRALARVAAEPEDRGEDADDAAGRLDAAALR